MEETTKKLKGTAVYQDFTISQGSDPFRMICLGASAGGLEALERFFRSVPEDARDVFVIVQHLSPDHKSIMTELLRRYTLLPAVVVDEGMIPEPGRIHLIPPGKDMILREGVFRLQERSSRDPHFPINGFLQSMARDWKGAFVGIILSGTGSDGSLGIQAVHAAGGLVLAQDVGSARFDGMPRSAEFTKVVDFIGTPEQMVSVLYEEPRESGEDPGEFPERLPASRAPYPPASPKERIFRRISAIFNVDFSQYKDVTILRRLERRMAIRGITDMKDYAEILETRGGGAGSPLQGSSHRCDILFPGYRGLFLSGGTGAHGDAPEPSGGAGISGLDRGLCQRRGGLLHGHYASGDPRSV